MACQNDRVFGNLLNFLLDGFNYCADYFFRFIVGEFVFDVAADVISHYPCVGDCKTDAVDFPVFNLMADIYLISLGDTQLPCVLAASIDCRVYHDGVI